MNAIRASLVLSALFLTRAAEGIAGTTWYVSGVNGSDSNSCKSPQAACKTIGHAISLAASGDSIRVAAATYTEHIVIGVSLNVIGAGASTTIIDGGRAGSVVAVYNTGSIVGIANVTIRNGFANGYGGGVFNEGILTINSSTISGNEAFTRAWGWGGGISNFGALTINNSTLSGNIASCGAWVCNAGGGGINNGGGTAGGGGINNGGVTLTINNSTLAGNSTLGHFGSAEGGAILSSGVLTINNSTIVGNTAGFSNGIAGHGGGIYGHAILQNSILANNTAANCYGPVTSSFSLSSDNSCNLNGPGDLNNVNPKLGTLGNYGGPTQTIPLLSGSPAIDAGNPSGCTDYQGHLLTTDQRGNPRPDREDTGGCDMGAYESQTD